MKDLYYIQNVPFRGDCILWWAVDGKGYTRNLDRAWKVTKKAAEGICAQRPLEDFMHSVTAVDALSERHVMVLPVPVKRAVRKVPARKKRSK